MKEKCADCPFAKTGPGRFLRTRRDADLQLQKAAPDMLTALEHAMAFIAETQEYKTGHTGAFRRDPEGACINSS